MKNFQTKVCSSAAVEVSRDGRFSPYKKVARFSPSKVFAWVSVNEALDFYADERKALDIQPPEHEEPTDYDTMKDLL